MLTGRSERRLKSGNGLHGIGGEGRSSSGSTDDTRSSERTDGTGSSHLHSKRGTDGERRESLDGSVSSRIGRDREDDSLARQMNLERVVNML